METTDSPQPEFSDNNLNNATSDDYSAENHLSPPPSQTPSEPVVSDSQLDDTSEQAPDSQSQPFDHEPTPAVAAALDAASMQPRKRRRRKKLFPEMISSAAAVHGLRILRGQSRNNNHSEKSTDDAIEIDDAPSKNRCRRRRISDITKEVDIEALIAISVGFPVDSLTEEEIEANVVSQVGGNEQANYIIVRNHILARWRSNVSVWMTKDHALESIRAEHRGLVHSAY